MCLSIPGLVVKISGKKKEDVTVDYGSEKREVKNIMLKNLKVGDYVIISNQMVIQRIPEKEANRQLEAMKKITQD